MNKKEKIEPIGQILTSLALKPPPNQSAKPKKKPSNTDCRHCQSLESCQYPNHRGYRAIQIKEITTLIECPKLTAWKAQRKHDNLFKSSNIPNEYSNLRLNTCHLPTKLLQTTKAAIQKGESIYISGNTNSGKTYLLSLIGNEYLALQQEVTYITAAEMLLQLRYTNETCEARLQHYQTAPILLLDDLGKERQSDYNDEQLYMVLNGRQRHSVITVIGSNHSLRSLEQRYKDYISSKIKQLIKREEYLKG